MERADQTRTLLGRFKDTRSRQQKGNGDVPPLINFTIFFALTSVQYFAFRPFRRSRRRPTLFYRPFHKRDFVTMSLLASTAATLKLRSPFQTALQGALRPMTVLSKQSGEEYRKLVRSRPVAALAARRKDSTVGAWHY